jgi:hypothetical protein
MNERSFLIEGTGNRGAVHTKTRLQKHAFIVDILRLTRHIAHADLIVLFAEPFLQHVQCQIAIRAEADARAESGVKEKNSCLTMMSLDLPYSGKLWGCFIDRIRHSSLFQAHGQGESPNAGA